MNVQRKRIKTARQQFSATETAVIVVSQEFEDGPAVNIHGLRVDFSCSPFGPEETLLGRWYVVLLPHSVNQDTTLRNQWIANLDTTGAANGALDSAKFVWGAGSFIASDQTPYNMTFVPGTSRNADKGSRLAVIYVADAVSGVVDDHDITAIMNYFTSN